MRIEGYRTTKEQTVRIPLEVEGEDCFIEVYGVTSKKYAEAMAWFKRACSEKIMGGVELISTERVLGEDVLQHSDEYSRLNAILFAHLICDWGFEDELSLDNACKLLIAHPSLCTAIDEQTSMIAYSEATAKKPQSPTQEEK